ncbi:MAG: glycoside hydrolase [Sulfobacillus acidophilus]|uniref:Glycoside hydrolase n=1 Tax=Sulfobacillus acidophilus TaxID=53633 RepID=A0A2T2WNM4_9FIRM|nr:MAG: glycoside hydrolase [Sulfobacillus acidophilus]
MWFIEALLAPSGPAAMPPSHLGMQVVGFYENKVPGDGIPSSESSFNAHYRQLTQVSPLWFSVTPAGTVLNTGFDARFVADAEQHHVPVVPLFVNTRGSSQVLLSRAMRRRAAANITQVVQADHLSGASIDFELLSPSSRADLSRFVHDLSSDLHPQHKVVAVSVFPLLGVPTSINGAYDYRSLARNADYLVIMAYDHHYSGGLPGPVAPYSWVKNNVVAALKEAPPDRLVLSIGMYGYDWINNGQPGVAPTVADVSAKALAKSYGVPIRYVAAQSQNEFVYTQNGVSHVVWFMGDRSAAARVKLARQYHLAGISLWRLGMEEPGFWHVVP